MSEDPAGGTRQQTSHRTMFDAFHVGGSKAVARLALSFTEQSLGAW